ncbi:uncharacterized protein LOC107849017 [Capsicum annuum]|uniref:uncharacterized protein LOC107849017 n=1 Tax=Capsicum annuum TaxID=4072 RepID=UPI001FB077D1|nr:uncharacterized protein LOC107849017 [Capsicum annuum]
MGNAQWVLQQKLKALSRKLSYWSKNVIGNVFDKVQQWKNIPKIWKRGNADISDVAIENFSDIFTKEDTQNHHSIFRNLEATITAEDNIKFHEIPTEEEIKDAVFFINPDSATVPLCDVLAENGKVEQEFTLSSSDLFYSPLDSVQLTLTYTGATLESLGENVADIKKLETLTLSSSAESSPSNSIPKQTSSAPSEETALSLKESKDNAKAVDSTSPAVAASTFTLPVVNLNIAPEKKLVQQDIVDIHNKSMQQFAEDLEKMKLPLRY